MFDFKNIKGGHYVFKFIVGEGIVLKLLENEHAVPLSGLVDLNRTYLREWLPWLDSNTKTDDFRGFIEATRRQFAANQGFQAGIWFNDELCGVVGFHGINWANKHASIGYWLAEKYRGHGIMTQSCKAIIDHTFRETSLNRVEIRCAEMNIRSRAIPERLGLTQEGIIRDAEWLYDHYVDHVVYSVLSKEWL